ncbi:metallophosphoesterase family protein [Phenylobacterium sp. LjRoot219]|uniref:metallophosphoesterase family protein n=1 Tax=Phenylobacterium sp. LjRoot219 TaxID=3342283 RepID=UPI003ECC3F2C
MIIGLLSDAHGNLEAFEKARRVLDDFGAAEVYFLGDAVGYLPGADVATLIVDLGLPSVLGNHEAMLLDPACGRSDRDPVYRLAETAAAMPARVRRALQGWPDRRDLRRGCGRVVLVHGSPAERVWGYVYPDTDLTGFAGDPSLDGAFVFMGNTHRPFVKTVGATTFVNVGSCGLPRDVGHLGACCLLDDQTGEVRIIRFDIRAETAAALERCGPVHARVLESLGRREKGVIGELV